MLARADELGIPHSRVYATGSNSAKVEKVKELGIEKHYDNNSDVIKDLPSTGEKFASQKLKRRTKRFGTNYNMLASMRM